MKILVKLEKVKSFWFLTLSLFIFFILRLPSLFEPYWYGDEGIYHVIGLALNRERLLYKDIWDNKPPLLYLLYSLFGSDQFFIRLLSLIFGLLSVLVFFLLAKRIFASSKNNEWLPFFSTFIFALLFALPLLEGNIANAENFMLLPIITAGFLTFNAVSPRPKLSIPCLAGRQVNSQFSIFLAGLLLGIAFLFKVVAVFDFAAFFLFIFFLNLKQPVKSLAKKLFPLAYGFAVPFFITLLFFLEKGELSAFMEAVFFSNIPYVNYENEIAGSPNFLLIKLAILGIAAAYLFRKKNVISHSELFVLVWLAFSLFNAFFSQRPYTHYLLVLLPSFALTLGLIGFEKKYRNAITILCLITLTLSLRNFNLYSKILPYYQNFLFFLTGQKSVTSYQSFFDKKTPIDYELALFLKSKLKQKDGVFIFGNNAQLYKLLDVLPPGRFIPAYHIMSSQKNIAETKEDLLKAPPRFVIVMPKSKIIPFSLANFRERIDVQGALVYERVF